jgi:hypothetical protein
MDRGLTGVGADAGGSLGFQDGGGQAYMGQCRHMAHRTGGTPQ